MVFVLVGWFFLISITLLPFGNVYGKGKYLDYLRIYVKQFLQLLINMILVFSEWYHRSQFTGPIPLLVHPHNKKCISVSPPMGLSADRPTSIEIP